MANKYLAAKEAGNNRNSNYNLSEASKKSKTEFGEANTAASLLYERFKKIMGQKWERERFDRFKKLMLAILRSGHSSLAGQRKLWDGNISRLLGYELNSMLSISRLFNAKVEVEIEVQKEIRINIFPFLYHEAFRTHKDAHSAELKVYFLSFDLLVKSSEGKSMVVLNQPVGKDMTEMLQLSLPIADVDNRMILLLKQVYFKRKDENGLSVIRNMRFIAADIIAVAYIRNGSIVQYEPEELPVTYLAPDEQGIWKDMD